MTVLINTLAVALTLGVVAWASDLVRWLGVLIYTEQYIAAMLAIALPLIYLHVPVRRPRSNFSDEPARRTRGPIPWYDALAAMLGAAASLYVAIRFPVLSEETFQRPWDGLVVAGVLCLLFAEGLRRPSVLAITTVAVSFFVLALLGRYLPEPVTGRPIEQVAP